MLLVLLLACSGGPFGTWRFTLQYTDPTGDECATTVTHNFISAYTPPPASDDPSFSETHSATYSPQVFFGRVERTATGSAMVVNGTVLEGVDKGGGAWDFTWTRSAEGQDAYTHVTGYGYSDDYTDTDTVLIGGTFAKGVFTGSFNNETVSSDAYTESDTWSDEAAAYIGTTGLTPASTYLLKLDESGNEVPVTNTQSAYDCSSAVCSLSVQDNCAWRYELTAEQTDFSPDDATWVEDAAQPAGI